MKPKLDAQAKVLIDLKHVDDACKWSPDHCDPSANLVLVSKNGIHFRVHAWYLIGVSGFIGDMFDVANQYPIDKVPHPGRLSLSTPARRLCPSAAVHEELNFFHLDDESHDVKVEEDLEHGELEPTVELDTPSSVLHAYIGLAYSNSRLIPALTMSELISLHSLCDRMQTTIWDDDIQTAIRTRLDKEPWEGFLFACKCSDLDLGRAAISKFSKNPTIPPMRYPQGARAEEFQDLSQDWLFEFCRLHAIVFRNVKPSYVFDDPWERMAKDFTPVHGDGAMVPWFGRT